MPRNSIPCCSAASASISRPDRPDRWLHDRLRHDLARQRRRGVGVDVGHCRRRLAGAARAQYRIQCRQRDCGVQPVEKMLAFAMPTRRLRCADPAPSGILWLLLDGIASVLARYTFLLHSSPRPSVFLIWLIVPGIISAWLRGERQTAIQALVLLLAAAGIDALGVRRRIEIRIFHLHRSPDHPRRRDPARLLHRPALSQMGLPCRSGSVWIAHRGRPGRARQIRPHAEGAGADM